MLLNEIKKFEQIDFEKMRKTPKKEFVASDVKKYKKPFKAIDFKQFLKDAPVASQ